VRTGAFFERFPETQATCGTRAAEAAVSDRFTCQRESGAGCGSASAPLASERYLRDGTLALNFAVAYPPKHSLQV
jgi:hypothetical protein